MLLVFQLVFQHSYFKFTLSLRSSPCKSDFRVTRQTHVIDVNQCGPPQPHHYHPRRHATLTSSAVGLQNSLVADLREAESWEHEETTVLQFIDKSDRWDDELDF